MNNNISTRLKKLNAKLNKDTPYVKLSYVGDTARYQKEKFIGNNKLLIDILEKARLSVGPADGNTFIAMADYIKQNLLVFPQIKVEYYIPSENLREQNDMIIY